MSPRSGPAAAPRILVIKLGALGDFILSWRAMTAIRKHHAGAHLVLLTIASLEGLARATGLFDEIWIDSRPRWYQPGALWALARRLNGGGFDRVYDLQTADRTALYFRLMGPPFAARRPEWCGHVSAASHSDAGPRRTTLHTLERQAEQLAIAGIGAAEYPPVDLSWVKADVSRHGLAGRAYVLLVPGGSAGHPEKRWPARNYAALAKRLATRGLVPVVIGTSAEKEACATVCAGVAGAVNLCDDSPILEVLALARDAAGAVGNDTGPMHLVVATGCPSLVLFSGATDPALTRPRGPYEGPGAVPAPSGASAETVAVLRAPALEQIGVDEVADAMMLREPGSGA